MHAGTILLSWIISAIVFVALLIASGMLTIHVEIIGKDEKKKKHKDDNEGDEE